MNITKTESPSFNNPSKIIVTNSVHFPNSGANTVHQSGRALSKWSKGLTVNIFNVSGKDPHAFEIYTDNEMEYGEGSLGFSNLVLEDYDGVFSLPNQVMDVLDALGYNTLDMRESLKD